MKAIPRKARREHRCQSCCSQISVGEPHTERQYYPSETAGYGLQTWRNCRTCEHVISFAEGVKGRPVGFDYAALLYREAFWKKHELDSLLPEPIPYRGQQGLWTVPEGVLDV